MRPIVRLTLTTFLFFVLIGSGVVLGNLQTEPARAADQNNLPVERVEKFAQGGTCTSA